MLSSLRAAAVALALTAALVVPAASPAAALTPAGSLDLTFGSCGVRRALPRTARASLWNSHAPVMGVQSDGKIVMAGSIRFGGAIVMIRLLPDGRWDHSFGDAGTVVTSVPVRAYVEIEDILVQPDGRLVVSGWSSVDPSGPGSLLAARYLSNGTLDSSFGTGGFVTHPLEAPVSLSALQPDGKLLGGGRHIFRLLPDGGLDPSFGVNGVAPAGQGGGIALQPDGKIVAPFTTSSGPPAGNDFTLLRLLPDGTPDPSFHSAPVDMAGGHDSISDVAVGDDGQILTAGSATLNGPSVLALTRHLPNGDLDATFGDGGKVFVPDHRPLTGPVEAIVPDNGAVVVAFTDDKYMERSPSIRSFALARFTSDGERDPSFGDGGVTVTTVPDSEASIQSLARHPSGDWLVGGRAGTPYGEWPATVVRYRGTETAATPTVSPQTCRREAIVRPLAGWNFDPVGVGRRSPPRTYALSNTGTAPVRPTRVGLGENEDGQFQIVADACTGATVNPGGACAISVVFAPTRPEPSSAELVVWDEAGSRGWQVGGIQGVAFATLSPMGWGGNGFGQLANVSGPLAGPIATPNPVSVAAGYYHSLALRNDGTVWAWGWNGLGQLGDGTTLNRSSPVKVSGLTDVVAIAAGAYHNLALRSDGTVWAWGWNYLGQLGDGSTIDRRVPVRVEGLPPVIAVTGGWVHSVVIGHDGFVRTWGWNGVGQLGDGSISDRHRPALVPGLHHMRSVAAGIAHSLAVRDDGALFAWGWNALGQLGDGSTADRVRPVAVAGVGNAGGVAAGGYHSLVTRQDGGVWAWGWNAYGQLGDGTTASRVVPTKVAGLAGVRAVAGGFLHSLAAGSDGTVRGWGWNWAGQAGIATTDPTLEPVSVHGTANARVVSAGAVHSLSG